MTFGLMQKIRNKLAILLVTALMATSVMPAAAETSIASTGNSMSSVTETVYDRVYAPLVRPAAAAAPLSWNVLSKLSRGLLSMTYAAANRPISELSADERYLAFLTYDLTADAGAGRIVVQIQDRRTGEVRRIQTPSETGWVHHFDMTPDARYIAYSYSEELVSPNVKVYLYDRVSQSLTTINAVGASQGFPDFDSEKVAVSDDGRFVAFDTAANGLVSGDQDGKRDVYLYDRDAPGAKLQRLSTPIDTNSSDESLDPSISADGSKIAFVSKSKLTAQDDYIGTESLYLFDRTAADGQQLKRITQGYTPSLSGDGRLMAFTTYRDDLGTVDTNGKNDIYVYDDADGSFRRVSFKADGTEFDQDSSHPSISRSGAYVAYETVVLVTDDTGDVDEESEVYVSDSQGLNSARVAVPGAPYSLIPPGERPAVSDTGTVNFYSFNLERFGGTEIPFPDYFIAANGTMPVWPAGSSLQASDAGKDHITLSWPGISDPDGVTGYALYKNGIPIQYIPATGQASYSVALTNQVREEAIDDVFQVEAIDGKYHWSSNGPTYTWESDGGSNPPPTDLMLNWRGERSNANGPLKNESTIKIIASGMPGLETKVEWTYKEELNGTETTQKASVPLTEGAANTGIYQGAFKMSPNATELTSILLKQRKADGTEMVERAEDLPIPVGGTLQIQFANASLEELQGAILTVWGPEGDRSLTVGDKGVEPLTGLMPGDEYQIYLHTSNYQYEMGRQEGITIRPGRTSTAILPVTVPAQVRVKVVNAEGKPVANVPVTLWDAERELLMMSSTAVDGMTYAYDGLLRDQIVTAELDLGDLFYELAPGTKLNLKLEGGENVLTVHLISPDRGMMELTVRDPANKPVFNAYVTATQTYKGQPVVTKARTSLDGKVRMELFAGEVLLEATETSNLYNSGQIHTTVAANTTTIMDIPVRQPGQGIVNLRVFKKALDTEWQGPLNMENEMFLSHVQSKFGWVSTYFSNAVSIGGSPGTPVNVCVSGAIYAYVSQCKDVILDNNSNATAEIRLEETGARVQGKVELGRNIYYGATVYELKDNGSKVYVSNAWDNNFQTDVFNINVPRSGHYRLEANRSIRDANYRYRYEYATVDFSIAANEIKNLGQITFSPARYFANQTGNHLMAQTVSAMPGSTISLRASYRNNNNASAENALLVLDIPEGTSLVTDNLGNKAVTGAKGPITVAGNTLSVPLGNLAKNDEGSVVYKLAVSSAFNRDVLVSAARIQATLGSETIEEKLGTVYMDAPKVTLEAPERVSDPERAAVLTGFAPAGSTLMIYDSNVRIGGAVANASGVWKTPVTLADLDGPGYHVLWAETSVNGVGLKSSKVYVMYDANGPQLLRMAMAQAPAGRWVTAAAGKEVPDFAYTVVPGNPFLLDFEFSNPDQVENVRVYMDGQEGDPIEAVREGELFRATVPTTHDALGGIYIDYDVKKPERVYDGAMPDLDQVRASLPPMMRDFEVVSKTPFELANGVYSGTVVLKFPQLGNKVMTITLTVDPDSNYRPTESEKELAARSGVPAIQSGFEVSETETSLSIKTRGYMPSNLISEEFTGLAGLRAFGRPAKAGDWGHTAEYFMEIKSDVDEVKGQIDEFKGQYEDYMGFAGKVNKIMYNVETSGLDCLEELPATVKQGGKALAALVVGEVAKTALGAWTGAMALTGGGAVVAGFATGVLEDKIDNYVDEQIDAIGSGYNKCSDNPDRKKNKGRKIARPKWIYDPSGYVYEAVKSNPLPDVTATVSYLDKNSGVWESWDAKEYDQINPQLTDAAGKYGWDVPPGRWKVTWSKKGYQTMSSDELDVPPPRTEVNAGMISRDAPTISSVTGVTYAGGSYVDITFSKYLKVVGLKAGAVTLTLNGQELEGIAAFIQQEASASDETVMLSRTIRFTPKAPLTGNGAKYELQLDPAYVTSYAGVKMTAATSFVQEFTPTALDTAGPALAAVKVESGGRILRLTYNEPIAATADPGKIRLNGTEGLITSAVAVTQRDQTESRELLLTVDGKVPAASVLTLLEGAVKDLQGNASPAATANLAPDSNPPTPSSSSGGGSPVPSTKDPLDLGEKAVVEKKTSSTGGTILYLTIGKEAITEALKQLKPSQELYIGVKEPADEIILQFPAESIGPMADAHAILRVTSDHTSIKLDPSAFSIRDEEEGAKVRVTLHLAKGQLSKEAEEAARKVSLDPNSIAGAASVVIETVNGAKVVLVPLSKANAIEGNFSGLQGKSLDIYRYDPAAAAWSYVRSKPNGDQGLKFDMSGGGIFAVMSYANSFTDTHNHWAMEEIDWMARRLLVNGVSPSEFRPEGAVSRAEFAAMLVRALGIKAQGTPSHVTFSDVSETAWYYREVLAAAQSGLVNGLESGRFAPDENITREQMAVMMARAYSFVTSGKSALSADTSTDKFKDSDRIQSWAKDAVALVVKMGIMQGMTDDTYVPEGITTRAQAAVVLKRFLMKQEQE
ncbi:MULTISPECIES: S-layer homology domain-containing protein [unclassified Paenibacillus]|uniref:S-layer homology domain-containing protein n=1 Tax=unclassified Paenibacillus TaxID=185978 RepID=UPI00237852C9|nr:S-layer homology domain-containing protein [Paenibacillus sp. MAHUQ-63]